MLGHGERERVDDGRCERCIDGWITEQTERGEQPALRGGAALRGFVQSRLEIGRDVVDPRAVDEQRMRAVLGVEAARFGRAAEGAPLERGDREYRNDAHFTSKNGTPMPRPASASASRFSTSIVLRALAIATCAASNRCAASLT